MEKEVKNWKKGILIGISCSFWEGVLLSLAQEPLSIWLIVQSLLFWFGCGYTVYYIQTNAKVWINSILFTLLLNAPWYINIAVIPQNYPLLPPLLIASISLGLWIGFLSQKLQLK